MGDIMDTLNKNSKPKILIIEDETDLIYILRHKLEREGYAVFSAQDGGRGLQTLISERPDLVLLDVLLPMMDGWETCRRIRQVSDVPIILITCLSDERDKVRGLELGADDYITKPFGLMELVARVRAVLRRRDYVLTHNAVVNVDHRLTVDRQRRQAFVEGQPVSLSPIEYRILTCFLDNVDRVITHQSLLTQVWGWEYADETDYLKVHIHNLRKKIEEEPSDPVYIVTERGLGYRFRIP
ncbi:MAG: response regulator transcription factor [Anaerolineae bacterium]